jgi:hypothetical protein
LVRELLLARTDGLEARQMAAFVDGWTSVLELIRRTDLTVPDAQPALHSAIGQIVERIRAAQAIALDDEI